jgi:hypothetical protein
MSIIEKTRVPPAKVWQAWVHAHALRGEGVLREGATGHMGGPNKKIAYKIENVIAGKCFSIRWKGLCVRFVFHHLVLPFKDGSEIRYDCEIQGLCGWMVRWFLIDRIRTNLKQVLKAFVQKLEMDVPRNAYHR